jgi:2-dehydro-3-deoxygluconokinase
VGGITAALGEGPLAALRSAMATARERGVRIVFDCNFRPSLWQGREDQAKRTLRELSLAADVLLADPRVIGLMLDRTFADPDPATAFQNAAQAMFALAPALTHVAATHREVSSSDNQRLTGLLASRAAVASTAPVALAAIVDRIGTGDAFAAGIVHGLARGMAPIAPSRSPRAARSGRTPYPGTSCAPARQTSRASLPVAGMSAARDGIRYRRAFAAWNAETMARASPAMASSGLPGRNSDPPMPKPVAPAWR